MSNRSYLIGLYLVLASLMVGCLFLFGTLFAHANNHHPQVPNSEVNSIINDYQYFNNAKINHNEANKNSPSGFNPNKLKQIDQTQQWYYKRP